MVTLILILLAAPAQADAAIAVRPDPGPLTCSGPAIDNAVVIDQRASPPGGTFWLRQGDFASRLAGTLSLVDANGNAIVAAGVRRTVAAVSFSVPGGVVGGETFALFEDGAATGAQLAVTPPSTADATATLLDATPGPTEPDPCPEAFCSINGEVPRVQTVDVTYQGGPVLLDAAAMDPETVFVDTTPRSVDSMRLAHVDTPTTLRVLAGPARSVSMPIDVHVVLTAIDTRAVVVDQLLPLGTTEAPTGGVAPPQCTGGGPFPRGGCTPGVFGCGANCPPTIALLLAPLGLRRLRRLRR